MFMYNIILSAKIEDTTPLQACKNIINLNDEQHSIHPEDLRTPQVRCISTGLLNLSVGSLVKTKKHYELLRLKR